MKYFSRNLYNRMKICSLFPFKSIESVNVFWEQLYISDYRLNQEYYEKLIREAMPELFDDLLIGQRFFSKKGPSEQLLEQLKNTDLLWDKTCEEYKKHFESIKESLPKCILALKNEDLHDGRVVDFGMRNDDVMFIQLDTRFSEAGIKGIDKASVEFYGLKSIKTKGAIQLQPWLYSEVDLSDEGEFEFRILFEAGELTLVADDFKSIFHNKFGEPVSTK